MVPNGMASTSVMALFDIIARDFQQQKPQATPKNSSISRRKRLHVGFHDEHLTSRKELWFFSLYLQDWLFPWPCSHPLRTACVHTVFLPPPVWLIACDSCAATRLHLYINIKLCRSNVLIWTTWGTPCSCCLTVCTIFTAETNKPIPCTWTIFKRLPKMAEGEHQKDTTADKEHSFTACTRKCSFSLCCVYLTLWRFGSQDSTNERLQLLLNECNIGPSNHWRRVSSALWPNIPGYHHGWNIFSCPFSICLLFCLSWESAASKGCL